MNRSEVSKATGTATGLAGSPVGDEGATEEHRAFQPKPAADAPHRAVRAGGGICGGAGRHVRRRGGLPTGLLTQPAPGGPGLSHGHAPSPGTAAQRQR
jgi:hypothetical protein